MSNSLHLKNTTSTNSLMWKMIRENKNLPEGFLLKTDFQTAGKGQIGNSWEAQKGKNLLFSLVLYPHKIKPEDQFQISQLVSIAIKKTLDKYTDNIAIKWPNDIYWKDKKIAGILIENSLQGSIIKTVVIGIGLNVNQKVFVSDAPNPVSLQQITGKPLNRKPILEDIYQNIMNLYLNLDKENIRFEYSENLYRKNGYYTFKDDNESFEACIKTVGSDGQLELETKAGEKKSYYFKEVSFVI